MYVDMGHFMGKTSEKQKGQRGSMNVSKQKPDC